MLVVLVILLLATKGLGITQIHVSLYTCVSSDVQVCLQRLSNTFDLLLIFLCSPIQTLTLTPPPKNALLANMDIINPRRACTARVTVILCVCVFCLLALLGVHREVSAATVWKLQ